MVDLVGYGSKVLHIDHLPICKQCDRVDGTSFAGPLDADEVWPMHAGWLEML
jgi:hypothetical protein